MRVFLADDSPVVIERLKEMIAHVPGVEIVGQAGDVPGAQKSIRESNPDVVILDLHMPGGSGIEVLQSIKKETPRTEVIVLTNFAFPQYRKTCYDLGADLFLDKSTEFDKISEALLGP
jgi:DNA-binding NarL/FixJ family response regulator